MDVGVKRTSEARLHRCKRYLIKPSETKKNQGPLNIFIYNISGDYLFHENLLSKYLFKKDCSPNTPPPPGDWIELVPSLKRLTTNFRIWANNS